MDYFCCTLKIDLNLCLGATPGKEAMGLPGAPFAGQPHPETLAALLIVAASNYDRDGWGEGQKGVGCSVAGCAGRTAIVLIHTHKGKESASFGSRRNSEELRWGGVIVQPHHNVCLGTLFLP